MIHWILEELKNLLKHEALVETDASALIEMTHIGNRDEAFEWIGMINHSGQLGDAFREAVPIYNTTIRFKSAKDANEIWLMRSGEKLKFKPEFRSCTRTSSWPKSFCETMGLPSRLYDSAITT